MQFSALRAPWRTDGITAWQTRVEAANDVTQLGVLTAEFAREILDWAYSSSWPNGTKQAFLRCRL